MNAQKTSMILPLLGIHISTVQYFEIGDWQSH